jgi:hypothetical protein
MQPLKLSISIQILGGLAAQAALIKKSKSIRAEHFWLGLTNMLLIPIHELGQVINDRNFIENLRVEIIAVRDEMAKIKLNPMILHAFLDSKMESGSETVQIDQLERDVSSFQIYEQAHRIAVEHQAGAMVLWHFYHAMVVSPPQIVQDALKQAGVDLSRAVYGDVGERISGRAESGSSFHSQVKTIIAALMKSQNIILVFKDEEIKPQILQHVAYGIDEQNLDIEMVRIHEKYKPSTLSRSGIKELKDWITSIKSKKSLYFILPSYSEIADSGYKQTYLDLWDCSNHGILLSASEAQLKELKNSRKYRIIYIDDVSNEVIPNQL